jgi:ABC-type glycerol-3-phosphate transport system substrate-binding protein
MKHKYLPLVGIIALAVTSGLTACGGGGDGGGGSGSDTSTTDAPEPTTVEQSYMEKVADGCSLATRDPNTISLDTKGDDEYGSDHDDIDDVVCLALATGMPDAVVERIDHTRALDGMQRDDWSYQDIDFEASWTYHPDNGMFIVVEEVQS